jgi:guanine deaminase
MTAFALRGQTLAFRGDPFLLGEDAAVHHTDGAVVVQDGRIAEVGPAARVLAARPGLPVESHAGKLILAGFVDAHIHYPQTGVIASHGAQLLDWLERYTFPAERAFADPEHGRAVADLFLDECIRNGVTTACVYCTVHPQSVDAFFERARARGLRMAAGKVMMDRNAPDWLTDTAQSAYDDSAALIARWHGTGRATYAVTPRFAITSSPAQLEAAGALWAEHPSALMQTHVSENAAEIAWIAELFPEARDYMDVYEARGLVGPGAIFGHAIHLTQRERALFRDSGAAIAHCPTSNTFIGSGLFDLEGLRAGAPHVTVGLASDVGGGSSFSPFATMRTAYEVAQLRGYSLAPFAALYLATVGSARAMRMDDRIGNLVPGNEADIVVLDLASTPLIAARVARADSLAEVLFAQIILADDRAVAAVYSAGRRVDAGGQAPALRPREVTT